MDFRQHELEMEHIGREEGRTEERIIMVRAMHQMLRKMNIPANEIVKKIIEECPDISKEEIRQWINES